MPTEASATFRLSVAEERMRTQTIVRLIGLSMSVALVVVAPPAQALDYFIDEVLAYNGQGCNVSGDLNDVTQWLRQAFIADGRTGSRYLNGDAWPQDFWESCNQPGGLDSYYADANAIAVFAGHGNSNPLSSSLLFGAPQSGYCSATMSGSMRLGQMSGATAGYAIYAASCVMATSKMYQVQNQWLHQQFGFHNSPTIDYYQLGDFYAGTNYISNKWSWLDELEDGQYFWSADNSPIVLSKSQYSAADALNKHDNFRFAFGSIFLPPMGNGPSCGAGQGSYWWYYTWIDNGGC